MKLGFTGSRQEPNDLTKINLEKFIQELDLKEIHHGDCVGSDTYFHNLIIRMNEHDPEQKIKIIIHPPNNNSNRANNTIYDHICEEKPYLQRNKDIVDSSDLLIAISPSNEEILRSGTWATIRYAKKRKIQSVIFLPNGEIKTQ